MKIYNKIVYIFFIGVIILFQILNYYIATGELDLKHFSYILYFIGAIALLIYIIAMLFKVKKITKHDIFVFILIILNICTTIFAYNPQISIWGLAGWYEGILSLSSYYFIFLLSTTLSRFYKKKLIYTFVIVGIFSFICLILQILGLGFAIPEDKFYSSIYLNSNLFACFSILGAGLSIGLYCIKKNLLHLCFCIIYIFSILISISTSGLIGLVVIFLFVIYKKKFKEAIILYLISLMIFIIIGLFLDNNLFKEVVKLVNETSETGQNINNITNVGTNRGYIYTETFKHADNYLLTGLGIDNFMFVNKGEPILIANPPRYVSKAHSDIIQILITRGLFSLILYLLLTISIYYKSIKTNKCPYNFCVFLACIGYFIQILFNISYIQVAPLYFMLLGILVDREVFYGKIKE